MAEINTKSSLRILLASAEVAPLAKAGGLADVAGALPKALRALGADVCIVMPAYRMILDNPEYSISGVIDTFPVRLREGSIHTAWVRRTSLPNKSEFGNIPVYLIGESRVSAPSAAFFEHATTSTRIYAMEPDPYLFFDRAVVEWVSRINQTWHPDIIHSNDWHMGLIPLFSRQHSSLAHGLHRPKHVFTVHNLEYQGEFGHDQWFATGLAEDLYNLDGLECYGKWSFMKGGLNFADYVTTVSPRYAIETQTPEYGAGLDGLLHKLSVQGNFSGIVNGIDTSVFNPESDPNIFANYSISSHSGKELCKAELKRELGLDTAGHPLVIGMVTRFVEQKGFELIHAAAERLMAMNVQLALLGTGDPRYERFLVELCDRHPGRAAVKIEYNAALAQRIYAGSDLFLMPSRFEPCGLGQLIALRYGAIPIVRATGGLADTIVDLDEDPASGTGFSFSDYTPESLLNAISRACKAMSNKQSRDRLILRAMQSDWSWDRSAQKYLDIFETLSGRHLIRNETGKITV